MLVFKSSNIVNSLWGSSLLFKKIIYGQIPMATFFLNLIFFFLSDTVSLSNQQMAMLIHIILQKLRQYQYSQYGIPQLSNPFETKQ